MALSEDRVLVSYEINLQSNTISILWHDRILRDGAVVNFVPHRGAYELVDGDLPEYIQDEFHISIATLGQEAIVALTQANAELVAELDSRPSQQPKIKY